MIYCNSKYADKIELVDINFKGCMCLKLCKSLFGSDTDIFLIHCYFPPEDSQVYKNRNSPLYDFDFFETISQDLLRYSALGDVIITGDHNARIGKETDLVKNINLDRYINMPTISFDVDRLPVRKSADVKVNTYGYKLLSLC